ncbi:hypothetical protein BX600DRAFT_435440 [Xylariales sp. PMI_506]|nr:hypothetical protein BX600DRAFT_435440 [Xylariales sp. PMI_506]
MFRSLLAAAPLAFSALAQPLEQRATTTNATLYAYGTGIGGVPVVYANDTAYISKLSLSELGASAANVTFTSDSTSLVAAIAGKGSAMFYVPSTSGSAGFTNGTNNSSFITSGFGSYGKIIYVNIDDTMKTDWYAVPTDDDHVWALEWDSDDENAISIALQSLAPSN